MCVKTGIPLMDPLSLLTIISIYNWDTLSIRRGLKCMLLLKINVY
jgi:hypothetical protein